MESLLPVAFAILAATSTARSVGATAFNRPSQSAPAPGKVLEHSIEFAAQIGERRPLGGALLDPLFFGFTGVF
jgi:hypothetical protein